MWHYRDYFVYFSPWNILFKYFGEKYKEKDRKKLISILKKLKILADGSHFCLSGVSSQILLIQLNLLIFRVE